MNIIQPAAILCGVLVWLMGSVKAQQTAPAPSVPQIQPKALVQLKAEENIILLDTRSPEEYREGHLANARFVNYASFSLQDVADISKDQKIIVYCKAGGRSNNVAGRLIKAGYKRVKSLEGGLTRWKEEGYPVTHE